MGLLQMQLVTERAVEAGLREEGPHPLLPAMQSLRERWDRMTSA